MTDDREALLGRAGPLEQGLMTQLEDELNAEVCVLALASALAAVIRAARPDQRAEASEGAIEMVRFAMGALTH